MKLMLDPEKCKSKPKHIAVINNRIVRYPVDITIEQLAEAVAQGQSFVTSYLKPDSTGKIRRAIPFWESQDVICLDFDKGMTIDEAMAEFKDTAAFIYKTFSYSEQTHKFRVVFQLDRTITDYDEFSTLYQSLLQRYPMADTSCSDGSRIFYGGTEVIPLNYSNKMSVGEWASRCAPVEEDLKYFTTNRGTPTCKPIVTQINEHLQKLREMDVAYFKRYLSTSDTLIQFYTYDEVYDHLKKQDLHQLLNLPHGTFECIYHSDGAPSANIFIHKDGSAKIYKCFSGSCDFGQGAIIKCVERLTGANKVQVIAFLKEIYGVVLEETNWQREQKAIIEENIRYITSPDFAEEYPVQHKLIRPYIENMVTFLTLAKDHVAPEHYTEDQLLPIFYTSMSKFAEVSGVSDPKRLRDRLAIFTYLCYIGKLKEDEIPKKLLKKAQFQAVKERRGQGAYNIRSFFEINSFADITMRTAEQKAKDFYDNNLTIRAWGYELLYRTFGKEEADRVYPQLARTTISERSNEHSVILEKIILKGIKEAGWIAERDVLDQAKLEWGGKNYKARQLKIIIQEVMDKYKLQRCRLNKDMKKLLKAEAIEGSPSILYEIKENEND